MSREQYEMLEEDENLRNQLLTIDNAKELLLHLKPAFSIGTYQRIQSTINNDGSMQGMSQIITAVRQFRAMNDLFKALVNINRTDLIRLIDPHQMPPPQAPCFSPPQATRFTNRPQHFQQSRERTVDRGIHNINHPTLPSESLPQDVDRQLKSEEPTGQFDNASYKSGSKTVDRGFSQFQSSNSFVEVNHQSTSNVDGLNYNIPLTDYNLDEDFWE